MARSQCSYNPRVGKSKGEKAAREFVRRHVRHHIKDLGMAVGPAVRVAYDEARALGYKVPRRNRGELPDAWLFGKGSADPLDLVAPSVGKAARGIKKLSRGKKKKRKRNPKRLGANPRIKDLLGPIIGEKLLRLEYEGGEGKDPRSRWYHDFKPETGAKVIGLKDGSVLLKRGKKPLWRMFK